MSCSQLIWLFQQSLCVKSRPLRCLAINTGCSEFAFAKSMFWHMLKERGIVILAWFQYLFVSSAPHVLGILIPVLALCSVCFGVIALAFAPRQKRMFWGHTLKERGILIFAWFLGSVSGLFRKCVCFGVIGLVFAPRQKRMSWGHTLKERGIVIFAWFQCFVWFERPSCFGHTHTCIGYVLCLLFSLFAVNECNFRIDKSIVRIVHTIIQSYGSNESITLLSPVNMRSVLGWTAPFNGSSFFVDPYGLYYGFFRSCQLERTRNIHVCLLLLCNTLPGR